MLKLIERMGDLPFRALMDIYAEGNAENGLDRWPEETPDRRIALAEEGFHQYLREVFFKTPGAVYALWEVEGKPVSALRLEPYRDGMLVSALETAPALRKKGYAKALLGEVSARFQRLDLYSHVGKWNVPSMKVHEKCGFIREQEYAVYLDGSVNDHCCTYVLEACLEAAAWS